MTHISGRTRVYAHLAHPSSHVRTPQMFNTAFADRHIDAVAVSVDVAPGDLADLVRGLRGWRNLAGLGVTMPHKQAMLALVDDTDANARLAGAVNTVRRDPDGSLHGTNTDGQGFVQGLRSHGHGPAGCDALVVGVGGAGRGIAVALAAAGVASLTLANRTPGKAEQLAAELALAYPAGRFGVGPAAAAGHDLVVNATSLGMHEGDALPVDLHGLGPGTVVAEIVMVPQTTPLMAQAAKRGAAVVGGAAMLTSQLDIVLDYLNLRESP